jgi:hypothetical protein
MPGVVLYCPIPRPRPRKSGPGNCQGTFTNQRAKNPPVNLRRQVLTPNSVASVQNRIMYLGGTPFRAFNVATY